MTTRQTSDGPALMAAAAAETARMVNGAPGTAALDAPAPCADWDLRTLLNHTILWTAYSAERRAYSQNVAEELMS
jgi:Mycothiol maleylpyruvate isomerase N-terminal domain